MDSFSRKGASMISEKLEQDMKAAMKAGEKEKLACIRMMRAELKNARIAQGKDLSDADEQKILASYAKKRKESRETYEQAGRKDLADKEQSEYKIVMSYLPEQLGDDDLQAIVEAKIEETGAQGPADMGKVMKAVMAEVGGRAQGSAISAMVKKVLTGGGS